MTLTLWRGDESLGALVPRAQSASAHSSSRDTPPSLSAFLVPASDTVTLKSVWQITWPPEFGMGVQQHAIAPDIVAERMQRAAARVPNPGPIALKPMSPVERVGVPQEAQLTVRATAGAIYLPRQIRLQEVRCEPAQYEALLQEVPLDALINGSVWCVFVAFNSATEAPDT